jgi:hypothetical protein
MHISISIAQLFQSDNLEGREHSGSLGINGRTVINCI